MAVPCWNKSRSVTTKKLQLLGTGWSPDPPTRPYPLRSSYEYPSILPPPPLDGMQIPASPITPEIRHTTLTMQGEARILSVMGVIHLNLIVIKMLWRFWLWASENVPYTRGTGTPTFWTEGYHTPTFRDEQVKNLLSPAVNSGDLRILNYNK